MFSTGPSHDLREYMELLKDMVTGEGNLRDLIVVDKYW